MSIGLLSFSPYRATNALECAARHTHELSLYNNYGGLYQDLEAGPIEIVTDGLAVGSTARQGGALKGIQINITEKDERVQPSVYPAQAGPPLSKNNLVRIRLV